MIVGFGRNDTKQSSRPTSLAESRAYSAPPVLQQYNVAPACLSARTRSTTAEIGMRLGPADRTSVSSTSTNTISDAGLTILGRYTTLARRTHSRRIVRRRVQIPA